MAGIGDPGDTRRPLSRKEFLAKFYPAYLVAQTFRETKGCVHIGGVDGAQDFMRGSGNNHNY